MYASHSIVHFVCTMNVTYLLYLQLIVSGGYYA